MNTFCSYYNDKICLSCGKIETEYKNQVLNKEKKISDLLNIKYLEPSEYSSPKHFRNKVKLVVTGDLTNPILGLWGVDKLDHGREILNCPLHYHEINKMLPIIKDFIKVAKIPPYNIENKSGEIKGIILFFSQTTNEAYLRFVLRSKESIDRIKKHLHFLEEKCPSLQAISVNIQPVSHAVLEGDEEIYLTSKNMINHQIGKLQLKIGLRGFVQTNQEIASKLYLTASQWVQESQCETMIELYCGQGIFSLMSQQSISKSYAIEINQYAIEMCRLNAQINKISNIEFISMDAENLTVNLPNSQSEILLINPPRRGLGNATKFIKERLPLKIIYSSCNIESLQKDYLFLKDFYSINRVKLFDMFPHTEHFETLVEMTRLEKTCSL